MKIVFTIIAAVSTVGLTVPVAAQTAPTQRVSYADLDTSTTAGMRALTMRVNAAARAVCEGSTNDLSEKARFAKCRKAAIESAMAAFEKKNAPLYASR